MFESSIVDLTILGHFFASATQHASVAMCQWTSGQVTLSLDEVREVPLEEVTSEMDFGDDLLTMVVLGVQGSVASQLILAFDEANGRQLAASLLSREANVEPEWSALEKSAIMETGNILGSAYLNELTRITARELVPSAPHFIQDYGASVLQQALMSQAMVTDRVLVCRTRFEFNKQRANWSVFFIPGEDLLHAMHDTVHRNPHEG